MVCSVLGVFPYIETTEKVKSNTLESKYNIHNLWTYKTTGFSSPVVGAKESVVRWWE